MMVDKIEIAIESVQNTVRYLDVKEKIFGIDLGTAIEMEQIKLKALNEMLSREKSIEQLESLKEHCEDMIKTDEIIWKNDVEALKIALKKLKGEIDNE